VAAALGEGWRFGGLHAAAATGECTKKRDTMNEGLVLIIIVAVWFILNRFVLPRLGVRT